MLVVRYADNESIHDINVSAQNALYVFRNAKRMYLHADLIYIEDNGQEFCLM